MGQTQEAAPRPPASRWLDLLSLDGEGAIGSELNNLKTFVYLFGQWWYSMADRTDEGSGEILNQSLWLWEHLTKDLDKAIQRAVDHNVREIDQKGGN